MDASSHIQEIASAHGRQEFLAVLATAAIVALLWTAGIASQRTAIARSGFQPHQRSAFSVLSTREQGLFNDLSSAAAEIRAWHADHRSWPDAAELATQFIPPFAKDAAWVQRGQHAWQRIEAEAAGTAIYWGHSSARDVAEWALVVDANGSTLWRRAESSNAAAPSAAPALLIRDDWKEFIARRAEQP